MNERGWLGIFGGAVVMFLALFWSFRTIFIAIDCEGLVFWQPLAVCVAATDPSPEAS